jgi:Right handed beta helix region
MTRAWDDSPPINSSARFVRKTIRFDCGEGRSRRRCVVPSGRAILLSVGICILLPSYSQGQPATSGQTGDQDDSGQNAITACQEITMPGKYSLAGNLLGTDVSTACLTIHDTQDVHLDCKFNAIMGDTRGFAPAISVTNVQGFSVTRCTLQVPIGPVLTVTNSGDGDLVRNTIGNLTDQQQVWIAFESVHNTRLIHNIINAAFQQFYSSGNLLRFNTATCPVWTNNLGCAGVLLSVLGSNNTMDRNQLDGKGSVSTGQNGADDGIIIQDESGDILSNNAIRNTWDAGIETLGNITHMQIASNSMVNVGQAGIGGWYWNSWNNVTVTDNTVRDARYLFLLFRIGGLRPQNWDYRGAPADTAVYFQENLFERNQFIGSSSPAPFAAYIPIYNYLGYNGETGLPGERVAQRTDFQLSDNTFARNDFGHFTGAPYFAGPVTAGKIIDGGRNICSDPGADYPLVCK